MTILDSSVWIALYNESDSQHDKAVKLVSSLTHVALPEYIIVETSSVLSKKAGVDIANRFLEYAFDSEDVVVLHSSPESLHETIKLFRTLNNPRLSFVDISLVYLSRAHDVMTFDTNLKKVIVKS